MQAAWCGEQFPRAGEIIRYTYDGSGNRTGETDANGQRSASTYDALSRLEEKAGRTLGQSDDPLLVSVPLGDVGEAVRREVATSHEPVHRVS